MRKIVTTVVLVVMIALVFSVPLTVSAFDPHAVNQGTENAHMNGIPSTESGEHFVPGLPQTPFAGSEVPGHDHVPE